jgi:hypothetical protein
MLQRAMNCYEDLFIRLIGRGVPQRIAVERVATANLDGRPLVVGKKKLTKTGRDSRFLASTVIHNGQFDEAPQAVWAAVAADSQNARNRHVLDHFEEFVARATSNLDG